MSSHNPMSTVVDILDKITAEIAGLREDASGQLALDVLDNMQGISTLLAGVKLQAITAARAQGRTWDEIGGVLGVSRQGAHKAFGYLDWHAEQSKKWEAR